jgi:hypothetical protein
VLQVLSLLNFYFIFFYLFHGSSFLFVVIPHMSDIKEARNVICQEISKVQTYESSEMQQLVPYTVTG